MADTKINDVYLIHSPLAEDDFVKLALSSRPYEFRLNAMHQVSQGLAHLHARGIMHRDLKPTNLMMVSYDPPWAIIIDYGSATFEETSRDHRKGTIAYLAPEVLQLKKDESQLQKDGLQLSKEEPRGKPYDNRCDIWGVGLCTYQLFYQQSCEWTEGVTTTDLQKIYSTLHQRPPDLAELVRTMLAWNPGDRPTASTLARSQVWTSSLPLAAPDSGCSRKRK